MGTPTFIPQNDPHDALIILNIHKWGYHFFKKKNVSAWGKNKQNWLLDLGAHSLNPPPPILGLETPPLQSKFLVALRGRVPCRMDRRGASWTAPQRPHGKGVHPMPVTPRLAGGAGPCVPGLEVGCGAPARRPALTWRQVQGPARPATRDEGEAGPLGPLWPTASIDPPRLR